FMRRELFDHVDIEPGAWNVPRGDLPAEAVPAEAAAYEARIDALGGADLCLLGIGRNGHIAFNEPGSSPDSRTRLIALDRTTRIDAAKSFGGLAGVPLRGVSMGIGSIHPRRPAHPAGRPRRGEGAVPGPGRRGSGGDRLPREPA
ncbi:6-phosphogluconolactonase, partial [Enterobacteriaceae bacterium H16N7]|nr:6-phosphogluconolactonase [Dryocola clanedunensis]